MNIRKTITFLQKCNDYFQMTAELPLLRFKHHFFEAGGGNKKHTKLLWIIPLTQRINETGTVIIQAVCLPNSK